MRNRSFTASCVAILFMSATFFASLLYLPQFMEKQFGYSPLEAGVGILPFLGVFAIVSFVAGPLYNRLGAKPLAVFGAACITVAPFLFSQVDARLQLRLAGAGHGRARARGRQLLPDRDDRRGHLGRRLPDQPRRRHHLHVPDRRRLDRPGPDHDRLLGRDPALRRRRPGRLPARRGALAGRLRWSRCCSSAAACSSPLASRRRERAPNGACSARPSAQKIVAGRSRRTMSSSPGPPRRRSSPLPPKSWSLPGRRRARRRRPGRSACRRPCRRPACRRRRRRSAGRRPGPPRRVTGIWILRRE